MSRKISTNPSVEIKDTKNSRIKPKAFSKIFFPFRPVLN